MKKKISLMIAVILILQVLLPMLTVIWESGLTIKSVAAETLEATVDGITWTYELNSNNEATNVKPKDKSTLLAEVIIPSALDGHTVTTIGDDAFKYCSSLTSITIPSSVTRIGDDAFLSCRSLTNINIPEGVTSIGVSAFGGCNSLTSINIDEDNQNYMSENGVLFNKDKTKLIQYFMGNKRTSYSIPEGVTTIGDWAFRECRSLTSINIPEGVTKIEEAAFYGCDFTNIKIPNSVNYIGGWAFYTCGKLQTLEIPENVTYIGTRALVGCYSLENITVNENNQNYCSENGILFNKDKTVIIKYSAKKEESSYDIPEGIETIEDDAFGSCTNLRNIKISSTVKNISTEAFHGCSNLENINIPEGLKYIEQEAFEYCSSLKRIIIPKTVTSIGRWAFSGCSNLENIDIPENVTRVEDYAFRYCQSLTSINIPKNLTNIGNDVFYDSKLTLAVLNGVESQEIMPEIISRALDENDILYAEGNIELENCEWNESGDKIKVNYEQANTKATQIKIKSGKLKGLTIVLAPITLTSEEYTVEETRVRKLQPETTVKEFKENIETNATVIEVYNTKGEKLKETDLIGTGMTLKLNGIKTYTLVVLGDVNGDSKANFRDILTINKDRLEEVLLQEPYKTAADVNGDGKADFMDILKINKYRLGIISSL